MHIYLTGTGSCIPGYGDPVGVIRLPGRQVTNEAVGQLVGYTAEEVHRKTGIRTRYYAADGVTTVDLALAAAQPALAQAGVDPAKIDHIFFLSMSPDSWSPMAADFQHRLGATQAALTPINVGCAGFAWAIRLACGALATGDRTVLAVCAERMSTVVGVGSGHKGQMIFGDGAGAVVLQPIAARSRFGNILPNFYLRTEAKDYRQIHQPAGSDCLTMDTPSEIARWANRALPAAIRSYCQQARIAINDIDWLLLHQANLRIIQAIRNELGLPACRVPISIEEFGNTSAASIPIMLDHFNRGGRFDPGDLVVCAGFGAGLNIGICAFRC